MAEKDSFPFWMPGQPLFNDEAPKSGRRSRKAAGEGSFVAPKNLTSTLVEKLAGEIRAGELEPGDRLPTEQEMVASYGVSKTVIREAVAALRSQGFVVTRHGIGTFVADFRRREIFRIEPKDIDTIIQAVNVLQLRLAIEVEAAALAAEKATEEDLRAIDAALAALDEDIARGDLAVESDFRFHRAIAAATANPLFPQFLDFLGSLSIPRNRMAMIAPKGAVIFKDQKAYLARIQSEHRRIQRAIVARNPVRARTAVRRHLYVSWEKYGEYTRTAGSTRQPD